MIREICEEIFIDYNILKVEIENNDAIITLKKKNTNLTQILKYLKENGIDLLI
jgi:precorrin-6B methylase 1